MHRALLSVTILTVAVVAAACQPDAEPAGGVSAGAVDRLEAVAKTGFEGRRLPGMAVAVLQNDRVQWSRGYGVTDVTGVTPIHDRTVFQLGSISKQFLAALVVALAAEGKLSLDDAVARHLPQLVRVPETVRVRHLLTHTSGIRELFQLPGALDAFDDLSRTRAELMAAVWQAPVDFAAGTRWSYSNTNYTILAALAESLTGKPYEDALADRFFTPLGLTSFRQCHSVPRGGSEALGHLWHRGRNIGAAPENMEWIRGDGGLCGSAKDLAVWTHLLATGQAVSPTHYSQMATRTRLASGAEVDYGFGLALVRPDGVAKVSHGGAMRGYSAQAAYYPERRQTVVVLTNRGDVRADAIEREISRAVLGLATPIRPAIAQSATERAAYVATYDIGVFDIRVVDRDGSLWLVAPPPGPTTPLRYLGDGFFVSDVEPDGTSLQFTSGGSAVRLYMGAMHWYGTRRGAIVLGAGS